MKKFIKDMLPWYVRYKLKYWEAKYTWFHLPLKNKTNIDHYNDRLYEILAKCDIEPKGKTFCELGPGGYATHAALLYQMGAEKTYMLDICDLVRVEQSIVNLDEIHLKKSTDCLLPPPPLVENQETWATYLNKVNGVYYTNGLDDYKRIPDESVDFCFSDAVFEHIRKRIFVETMHEIYRFMKKGSYNFHIVDLRDHMGGGKNTLRFSDAEWEDEVHYSMDNYTNRLSLEEIEVILKKIGFEIIKVEKNLYSKMPINRYKLAKEFKNISDEQLMIRSFSILFKK